MKIKKILTIALGISALCAGMTAAQAEETEPQWRVVDTVYETKDVITAGFDVTEFGAKGDGVTDDTAAFQDSINAAADAGGGTVFIPAGQYAIKGNLTLRQGVILRGDMKMPGREDEVRGTVLMAYAGRGNELLKPFITMESKSGVKNLAIWYPEQTADNIVPYPAAIQQGDESLGGANYCLVEDVNFVNSYIGFKKTEKKMGACFFVMNVCGSPLKTGVDIDAIADVGRVDGVDFSPQYWENSGLENAPSASDAHRKWMYEHAIAVEMKRNDWSYGRFLSAEGYNVGFYALNTMSTEEAIGPDGIRTANHFPNGENYGLIYSGCQTGIAIENTSNAGVIFTDVEIDNCENGIHLEKSFDSKTQILDARINAANYALLNEGSGGRLMLESCEFNNGKVSLKSAYTSLVDSNFRNAEPQLTISGSANALINGNRFTGSESVSNTSSGNVIIDDTPIDMKRVSRFPRTENESRKPAKTDLFNVKSYGAVGDAETDDTAAFITAFEAAAKNGGGIVFVPPGRYKITDNLTLPQGTELRGAVDIPHQPIPTESVIGVCAGKGEANGTPFMKLSASSIVRGISFDYPEQNYKEPDDYPYLLQGLGKDVSVINIGVRQTCCALDLFTYKCDNAYVNSICGQAWKNLIRVGGGSENVKLYNTQSNLGSLVNGYADGWTWNSPLTADASKEGEHINEYLRNHFDSFIFGDTKNISFYDNFIIPGGVGLTLIEENGKAPSGKALGYASDDSRIAFLVESVDDSGFDFINTQLVGTAKYGMIPIALQTGENYSGSINLFGAACWGSLDRFVDLDGSGEIEMHAVNFASQIDRPFVLKNGIFKLINSEINTYFAQFMEKDPAAKVMFISNNYSTGGEAKPVPESDFEIWRSNVDKTKLTFTDVPEQELEHALPSECFKVRVGDTALVFEDQPALQKDGEVFIPVRNIFERLYFDVSWDDADRKVSADDGDTKVEFTVGSDRAEVNGKEVRTDGKSYITGGRTMVGEGFIHNVLGSATAWDPLNRIYTIGIPVMKDTQSDSQNPIEPLRIYSSNATSVESGNENNHAYDGDITTRWAAEREQSITFDLGAKRLVSSVDIIFYLGGQRKYQFTIEVSANGENFTKVFDGNSAGETEEEYERFEFDEVMARYVRYNGKGSETDSGHNAWNSIREVIINGRK